MPRYGVSDNVKKMSDSALLPTQMDSLGKKRQVVNRSMIHRVELQILKVPTLSNLLPALLMDATPTRADLS